MTQPIILLGAGGHGGVVLDALMLCGANIVGICDPALDASAKGTGGLPLLESERLAESHPPTRYDIANGVGFMPGQTSRRALFENMRDLGYAFAGVRHPVLRFIPMRLKSFRNTVPICLPSSAHLLMALKLLFVSSILRITPSLFPTRLT